MALGNSQRNWAYSGPDHRRMANSGCMLSRASRDRGPHAGRRHRAAARNLRGLRQGAGHGPATFCTAPASCTGSARTMPMARPATGAAAALTLFEPWPNGSMPAPSIRRSRPCFPGSSSTRSGGTAPGAASMSATATELMTISAATISIAKYGLCAIGSRCGRLQRAIDPFRSRACAHWRNGILCKNWTTTISAFASPPD